MSVKSLKKQREIPCGLQNLQLMNIDIKDYMKINNKTVDLRTRMGNYGGEK